MQNNNYKFTKHLPVYIHCRSSIISKDTIYTNSDMQYTIIFIFNDTSPASESNEGTVQNDSH